MFRKKIFFIPLLLSLFFILGVFLMIDNPVKISSYIRLKAPFYSILRLIKDESVFDYLNIKTKDSSTKNLTHYSLAKINLNGNIFSLTDEYNDTTLAEVTLLNRDSCFLILWQNKPKTNNPFTLINYYWQGLKIKKKQEIFLDSIAKYFNNPDIIYGQKINHELVKYDVYLSAKKEFYNLPTTAEIYELIKPLEFYLQQKKIKILTPPMLNLSPISKDKYQAMVAFGIDTFFRQTQPYEIKIMVRGNILTSIVTGPNSQINKQLNQLKLYIQDYQLNSPAIPFQYILNNRLTTDSLHWKTQLNYPIY